MKTFPRVPGCRLGRPFQPTSKDARQLQGSCNVHRGLVARRCVIPMTNHLLLVRRKPRDRACPKGQHLTDEVPVVCVPNKQRLSGGINIDQRIIDSAAGIVTLALFVAVVAKAWSTWRRRRSPAAPTQADPSDGLPVGALMNSPSLGWGDLGWGSPRRGFYIPTDAVGLHFVVAGGSGSGKTNTSEVIEAAAADVYRPQIIHFDCKGSRDGMARFLALMAAQGYAPERVRLFPIEPYDGWRGGRDPQRALLARLVQVQDWSESFYAAATKDLLQRVLFDADPPACSPEFLSRLESLGGNGNAKINEGALARYGGFFRSLGGLLDGSWAFEDCDACYVQLEGFGLPSEAVALGRFLLEDFTHFLADRKSDTRPVLVVLDEFSAISTGADAANLVERAREFGAGIVLTTQSYAGLGSGAERVLDAARGGLIVHSLANPEPFTKRAGTIWRHVQAITEPTHQPGVISSILFDTKPPETPRKTTREQEFPRIDPNEVRQLPRGEAFVISSGRAQRVRFNEAAIWDENLDLARAEIERRRRGAVATRGGNGHAPPPAAPPADDDLDF